MRKTKKLIVSATAACLAGSVAITGFAATEHWNDNSAKTAVSKEWENWKTQWETIKTDYEKIALTPGADETKMNFAWYSQNGDEAKIRLSASADMTNTIEKDGTNQYQEEVTEYTGSSAEYKEIAETMYYANKVTADSLKENTTYYYQYYVDGAWSEVASFQTGDGDQFRFLYVGDPQIGASKGQVPAESESSQSAEIAARNDAYSWNKTLTTAWNSHPQIDFMVSAGDQINNTGDDNGQECEYAGFLASDVMKQLPVAATIGNHDSKFANFKNHFNVPNAYTEEKNATAAGNDYYYMYGSALFIVLNTNNYNCADHEALIQKAVTENPDATWRIVTFHQDIYGSGLDHSDSDGIVLRTQLTTLMDRYDIDVVLQGHDHTYSRSYMLTSDGQTHTAYGTDNINSAYTNIKDGASADEDALALKAEFLKENRCYRIADATQGTLVNPEGVLYMEANSSTGSKYYNLISTKQDYIADRSQTWTPTYSVVDVTKDSFTINTYDVNTGKPIDETFTIRKTSQPENADKTQEPVTEPTAVVPTVQPTQEPTTAPAGTPKESAQPTSSAAPTAVPAAIESTTQTQAASKKQTVGVKKLVSTQSSISVKVGKTKKWKVSVNPTNATDKVVRFTTSKKAVATINKQGMVKGKKAGKATITAKAGTKKISCKVTVRS